jgi:3-oxoacyl-[acyl-carrier-protein] synthase-3
MNGSVVKSFAIDTFVSAVRKVLKDIDRCVGDITVLVPHQANKRIIERATETLGICPSKVFTNIHTYGNTASASVPIALDDVLRTRGLESGALIVLVSFGGGLSWGVSAVTVGGRMNPAGKGQRETCHRNLER